MKWFFSLILLLVCFDLLAADLTEGEFAKFMQANKRSKGLALVIGNVEEGATVLKASEFYVHILAPADVNLQKSRKILEEKNFNTMKREQESL